MALLEGYFFVEHFRFWFVSPKWPGHLSRVEESSKSYQNNHKKMENVFFEHLRWNMVMRKIPNIPTAHGLCRPSTAADCFPGSYSTALENSRRSCLGASSGGELGQVQQEGHATTGEETQKMWGRSMCQHDAFFSYTTAK